MKKKNKEAYYIPYCETCGGCGYIGCDGVKDFLEYHVKGRTNCPHEENFIREIIQEIKNEWD